MSKNYFEITYNGPFGGNNVSLPEDVIDRKFSPYLNNVILKNGEIRPRPNQSFIIPSTPDGKPVLILTSFLDGNNVYHTVAVTETGLWQLNSVWNRTPVTARKSWSLIGSYPVQPGPNIPAGSLTFINKFFWTNGGTNLWYWDGISSIGAPNLWRPNFNYKQGTQIQDKNDNWQVAENGGVSGSTVPSWSASLGGTTTDGTGSSQITWIENGAVNISNGFSNAAVVDVTNKITAGSYFISELAAQVLMLNTIESSGGNFSQRLRWSPSGLPTIWDPNVNIAAGYTDELDVPDSTTGIITVGTSAFILRDNGISELTSNSGSATNPWTIDHLWASDRGIGNILPFGYASYGPIGIFASEEDIYNISLGGFKKIGKQSRDAIYDDIAGATNIPIGSIIPYYSLGYVYPHYRLSIPQGNNNVCWCYSIEDDCWWREYKSGVNYTGITRYSYIH